MSAIHWVCEGIGVNCNRIKQYLNPTKCLTEVKKMLPEDEDTQNLKPEDFDIHDYLYNEPFENIGDFLSRLDDTNVLTYGDTNDGESYCYYAPKYPWDITDKDPKSLNEARNLVKTVVKKVCNIDEETLDKIIDNDIYEHGCG